MLHFMKTPADVFDQAALYLRIYFCRGHRPPALQHGQRVLRAVGTPNGPLYFLILTSVLNIFLDLLFVLVFHWGIGGAGAATGLSQMVPVFLYLKHFLGPKATIRFARPVWGLGTVYPGGEDWPVLRFYGAVSGLHGIYVQPCHSAVYR